MSCDNIQSPVPLRFRVDIGKPQPLAVRLWRGETATISVDLSAYFLPLDLAEATATLCYQTPGMAGWWTAPASVSGATVTATWTPELDNGTAEQYVFFVRVDRADEVAGVSYRINGTITMLGSPGEHINVLPPPEIILDFAGLTVLNAPYYTQAETNAAITAATSGLVPSTRTVNGLPLSADVVLTGDNIEVSDHAGASISSVIAAVQQVSMAMPNGDGGDILLGATPITSAYINGARVATATDLAAKLDASAVTAETWTFEVDDGQGGTQTVTKSVMLAAGAAVSATATAQTAGEGA